MNWVYIGFAAYVIVDIIFSAISAAKRAAETESHERAMNTIRVIVCDDSKNSDEKVGTLKSLFDNNLLS